MQAKTFRKNSTEIVVVTAKIEVMLGQSQVRYTGGWRAEEEDAALSIKDCMSSSCRIEPLLLSICSQDFEFNLIVDSLTLPEPITLHRTLLIDKIAEGE